MKANAKHPTFLIPGRGNQRFTPIENSIQLEDYVEFANLPGSPGAAILAKGQEFQFKFGFRVEGIHPTLPLEQMESICSYLESSIKSLPEGETLTIVQSVKPDNSRLDYYQTLLNDAPNALFEAMVESAALPHSYFPNGIPRVYKRKDIYLYVTASSQRISDTKDRTEAVLAGLLKQFGGLLTAKASISEGSKLRELFTHAEALYEDWVSILGQMRIPVEPLTIHDLAAIQWREFNDSPPKALPQWIEWDGINLRYHPRTEEHLSSWFFEHQVSVPKAYRSYVVQRSAASDAARYTGVVAFKDKPAGWTNCAEQLSYLYAKADFLDHYTIVLTITKAPPFIVQKSVELIQRQSIDAKNAAAKRGLPVTRSVYLQEEADNAASDLMHGNIPVKMSVCFFVSEGSKEQLKLSCRKLQSQFLQPATLEVEEDYAYITWFQSFPQLSYYPPLFRPFERSVSYLASEIPAFMPIMKVTSPDKKGLEFVTENEGLPYYLDIAEVHRHILFLAITRSGKSVLFSQILMIAMCSNIPMVIVDYPRESGDSTFGPITRLAGNQGAYLNIAEESNNVLELPDLSAFNDEERAQRLTEVKDFVVDTLMIIMYGGNATKDDRDKRVCKSIFGNLVSRFYSDSDIMKRFDAAIKAPYNSEDYRNVPTLHDFTERCTKATLEEILEEVTADHLAIINEIKLQFTAFMDTTVGHSMSSPTSIPRNANLLVFAFKGVSNDEEAAVLMASAAAAAMRRTLSARVSILFLDEASILSKFDSLMAQAAKIAANGAKSGIRLFMALQTPMSLAASKSGPEILANMATRIIGRVDTADADNYSKILKIPKEVITVNTSKAFYPNIGKLYSRWLIIDRSDYIFARSYAPPLLLAAVANNPEEEEAKAAFLEWFKEPVIALQEFAKELILAGQQGRPLRYPKSNSHSGDRKEDLVHAV